MSQALRERLPNFALLAIDFLGSPILVIVTGRAPENCVISVMRTMVVEVVRDFDAFHNAIRKPKTEEIDTEEKKRSVETAILRLETQVTNSKNRWAIQWYKTKLQKTKRVNDIPAHDTNKAVT